MDMIKIACLGLSGVILGLFLKQARSSFAEIVSLASCLLIIFYSITKLSFVFDLLDILGEYVPMRESYFRILLKIIGITYVADFSSNLCRDAGYSAIAGQIEVFGKISVLGVSVPVIVALLETVYSFL